MNSEAKAGQPATGDTVIVGCRHPHGLILRLFDMIDGREAAGNGRFETIKVAHPRPESVKLNGYADTRIPVAVDGKGQYGTTREVSAAFFSKWLEQNKQSPLVTNGIVFAAGKEADFKALGKTYRNETTGLEPLDPDKPGARMGTKKIEKMSTKEGAAAAA